MMATLTFLGSGTSMGVPTLGCECAVCRSAVAPHGDPRNRRTRHSVLIEFDGHAIVIDTGPDFHAQALSAGITRLDAVFYTHSHADHLLGMDDLRPLSFKNAQGLPLFADAHTAAALRRVFDYTFRVVDRYPTSARVHIHELSTEPGAEVELFGVHFQRVPVIHGRETITGYRFGSAAYLTDMSDLSDESLALLQGLDVLILDALRPNPHPSHSHLEKSIRYVERLRPRRAFFTHMSHELDHATTEAQLPEHIRLAYDGLKLAFDIAPKELPPEPEPKPEPEPGQP
jgi:phosphoribosyl 1,2-cyclic phosphate phosphodiesterase